MRFRVYSAYYCDNRDLSERYPELMKYGYEFEITMLDHKGNPMGINYIRLYSLEELNELIEMLRNRINNDENYFQGIIVDIDENKERNIYIYDDYIE